MTTRKKGLIGVAVSLAAVLTAGAIWLLSSGNGDNDVNVRELDEAEFREYADEVVGVQDIIRHYREDPLVNFRSDEDQRVHDENESRWLSAEATDKEVERWWFVASLQLVVIEVERHLDRTYPDLFLPDGKLYTAYYEAMSQCAADHGYPGLILTGPPPKEYERLEAQHGEGFYINYRSRLETDFGITADKFFDIRHGCAKIASTYPTMDAIERDRILDMRHEEYWQAIKTVLLAEPDLIVPRLEPSECTAGFLAECAGLP